MSAADMSTPGISVVVPAYNAERYLAEALESVLVQTPPGTEVIVVDDGSTDGTAAVAESFAPLVRVLREPHGGIGAAFNRGMREARGTLIASIDADDRWLPGKLSLQCEVLDAHPSVDAVFGLVRQFLSPEKEAERGRFAFSEEPVPGYVRGVMLFRREVWERVGEIETHLVAGEFVSWYARAAEAGVTMQVVPHVVYERRVHGLNTVIRERDAAHRDYLHLIKATLDRRRGRP
jgi:glycosyltransferase involved in cell wall biosynthesis